MMINVCEMKTLALVLVLLVAIAAVPEYASAQRGDQSRRRRTIQFFPSQGSRGGDSRAPQMRYAPPAETERTPSQQYGQSYDRGFLHGILPRTGRLLSTEKDSRGSDGPPQTGTYRNSQSLLPQVLSQRDIPVEKENTSRENQYQQIQPGYDQPYSRNRIVRRAEEIEQEQRGNSGQQRSENSLQEGSSPSNYYIRPGAPTVNSRQQPVVYSRTMPGYDKPSADPVQVRKQIKGSTDRIYRAMQNGSLNGIDNDVEAVKQNVNEMKGRLRNQPLEDRLKLSAIERLYNDGTGLLEEGQHSGEKSKMRMGLEKIEKANEQLLDLR
jgi:hypothetical protein